MRRISIALAVLLLPSMAAYADCPSAIEAAVQRANALPPSAGRAAMLEQIQRAQVAHHEDDEGECIDQLKLATDVLDSIDAAKSRNATAR